MAAISSSRTLGSYPTSVRFAISGRVAIFVFAMIVVPLIGLLFSQGATEYAQLISLTVVLGWILVWIFRSTEDFYVASGLLVARVATVLVATLFIEPYYLSATGLDAELYHAFGMQVAQTLQLNGSLPLADLYWGVKSYSIFTGVCYLLFGTSRLAVKFLNTGIAAGGSIFFYKAYVLYYGRTSKPLRLLLFFSPSLLYWSSIHGKDPLTFFALGLGFWGTAEFGKRGSRKGYLTCLLAALCLFLIRPHIACVYLGALSMVFIVRSLSARRALATRLASISCLVLALLAANFAVHDYLQDLASSPEAILERVSTQHAALDTGNTALEVPSLVGWEAIAAYLPYGAATVMFRPFPWESGGVFFRLTSLEQLVLTAAEMTFIVFLLLGFLKHSTRGKRLSVPRAPTDVLTVFVAAYWIGFVLLFTYMAGNLGTLAREKIQLAPFIWCGAFAVAARYRDVRKQISSLSKNGSEANPA
jgi:hypothetical protein